MGEKDKLKQYLKYKGITKNKFYSVTGFSVGFLDSGKSMGADKIKIIVRCFPDLNLNWLLLDEGKMVLASGESGSHEIREARYYEELLHTKNELIELQRKQIALLEEKLLACKRADR